MPNHKRAHEEDEENPEARKHVKETPLIASRRDWATYPAIVEWSTTQDIYVIGDVHGDYQRLLDLLTYAKIIAQTENSDEYKWLMGQSVLVCTGDLIDKWKHSVKVLALFQSLQSEAKKEGGLVIVTCGNHEAEFLGSPTSTNQKAQRFIAELKTLDIDPEDVRAGTDSFGLGAFLRSLPFAAKINDWFFSHAGNTSGLRLPRLRNQLQTEVDETDYRSVFDTNSVLYALLESRLHPKPWWEDQDRGDESAAEYPSVLVDNAKLLGCKHFVLGHQPGEVDFPDGTERKKGTMVQKYDGLVFLVDVGMSRGIGKKKEGYSEGALLRISTAHLTATELFPPDESHTNSWEETLWSDSV